MFKAVCSNCGKECEVPFNPTGSKPVYCSDCFRKIGGKERNSAGARFDSRRGQDSYSVQFEAINAKLDKILNLLQSDHNLSENLKVVSESKEVAVEKEAKLSKTKKSSQKGKEAKRRTESL